MKYSKYFGAKRRGFIKSKSVLAPKGAIHLLSENIRYDIMLEDKARAYPGKALFKCSVVG
jgi:hypothetical protein